MHKEEVGRIAVGDRAATPSEPSPAVSGKAGIPCAERSILDWQPLRLNRDWEHCHISLDDARQLAVARYYVRADLGAPWAASVWTDPDGAMKLFCADYCNGRRLTVRVKRTGTEIQIGRTPRVEHAELAKLCGEQVSA